MTYEFINVIEQVSTHLEENEKYIKLCKVMKRSQRPIHLIRLEVTVMILVL